MLLAAGLLLAGCGTLQTVARVHGGSAVAPGTFEFRDGQRSVYYQFRLHADAGIPDTAIFLIGGSGCASWQIAIPRYFQGFSRPAHVFALNKRHVEDRSLGILPCSTQFHEHNNLEQWVADYGEIMRAKLDSLQPRPKHVVLFGGSEGALPASVLAANSGLVTHLALMGFGGWSILQSLDHMATGYAYEPHSRDILKTIAAGPMSLKDEMHGNPYRWWTQVAGFNPMPVLESLTMPIFVGMGEKDINVAPASALALGQRFRELGKTNLRVTIYPGADHILRAAGKTYRDDYFGALAQSIK